MPNLSLTDLVDIVSAAGTAKANKAKQIKKRPAYNPAFDFYKKIREAIVCTHRNFSPKANLDDCLDSISHKKKQTAYPQVVGGYKKWWGRKDMEWFEPPSQLFSSNGVDIRVNPELGLYANGAPHLVKLYFKSDKLAKPRIDLITHLMAISLSGQAPINTTMSVLDVRSSRLISPTVPIERLSVVIVAEMAYISTLWSSI